MSEGWVAGLAWRFVESEDGGLIPVLEPPRPLFAEAFAEAVGPWVLVAGEEVLGTHWVDRLIGLLERAGDSTGVEQLLADAAGAALLRMDDLVFARDVIFEVPDEEIAVAELLPALYAWRQQLFVRGASTEPPDEPRHPASQLD